MLSIKDKQFIALLLRSPDTGDGWRNVSKIVWPLVTVFAHQELIETKEGAVRLSALGKTVITYI